MTSSGSGAWTEPGAFEVAPGVHRVPLPLPNDDALLLPAHSPVSPSVHARVDELLAAQGRLSSAQVDGVEHYATG